MPWQMRKRGYQHNEESSSPRCVCLRVHNHCIFVQQTMCIRHYDTSFYRIGEFLSDKLFLSLRSIRHYWSTISIGSSLVIVRGLEFLSLCVNEGNRVCRERKRNGRRKCIIGVVGKVNWSNVDRCNDIECLTSNPALAFRHRSSNDVSRTNFRTVALVIIDTFDKQTAV